MCYCCRKLEKLHFQCVWGRILDSQICETDLWGHAPLIGSDRSDQIREPIRGAQPHTASHGLTDWPHRSGSPKFGLTRTRPHNFCHVICLSQSGEHGLTNRPHRFESPICEADLWGRGSPIIGPVWLISRLNALPRLLESDRTPTASQIGLTDRTLDLWGQIRTLWQITWLYGERPCSDSHGLPRPHRSASQIGLSDSLTDLTDQIDQMCHKSLTSCCGLQSS